MLDKGAKGWITAPELFDALSELNLFSHKEDIYLFTRRYDKDSDGRLLYSDFCDAFTPKQVEHSNALNSRKAYYLHSNVDKPYFFTRETRELFL